MKVEIWSDVACPWCFIGKRRFESALAEFPHKDEVEISWKSYQLDPSLPEHYHGSEFDYIAERKGMSADQARQMFANVTAQAAGEGLNYDFEALKVANSFTAHRLIHLAKAHDKGDAAKERLLSDHFEHGQDIGNRDYLTSLGADLELDPADVEALFTSDVYTEEVRAEIAEAQAIGVNGVPFFVFDRKYGVSGAQAPETFTEVLNEVWKESHPLLTPAAVASTSDDSDLNGQVCGPEGC